MITETGSGKWFRVTEIIKGGVEIQAWEVKLKT